MEQSLCLIVTRMKKFHRGIIQTNMFLNFGRRRCFGGLSFCPRIEWRNKLNCGMIGRVYEFTNRGECLGRVDIQMPEYFQIVPWFNFAVVRSPRIRLCGSCSLSLRHSEYHCAPPARRCVLLVPMIISPKYWNSQW